MCVYVSIYICIYVYIYIYKFIYLNNILSSIYTYPGISILIIIYHPILATINVVHLCEAPESNIIDSGAIQINCIII